MNYYVEITLLPSQEISQRFLWEKVFLRIHKVLVENKDHNDRVSFGISFPQYDERRKTLGNKLRIFSKDHEELVNLEVDKKMKHLKDYIHLTSIRPVPSKDFSYARFERKQVKSSSNRLAKRLSKRKGLSFEQALEHYNSFTMEILSEPFINMKSFSSMKPFKLFIKKIEGVENSVDGGYSTYGLSDSASVPDF